MQTAAINPVVNFTDSQTSAADDHSWRAWLDLSFEKGREKTVLRRKHFGPLVIQRPFYPEGRVCHAYILHPPGGVVGGDRLSVNVNCGNGASGLITTPGANRFYGSDGRRAQQQQNISVGDGCFEWLPMETIYFDNACVSQRLKINLCDSSRFIGWDISCFGRVAGDHFFKQGEVTNRIEVFRNNTPVLVDRLHVTGGSDLACLTGMQNSTVSGTMILTGVDMINKDMLELVRARLAGETEFAATVIEQLITVRYLGSNAEHARRVFTHVWCAVRPALMSGRPALMPRIWAT